MENNLPLQEVKTFVRAYIYLLDKLYREELLV